MAVSGDFNKCTFPFLSGIACVMARIICRLRDVAVCMNIMHS